MHRTPSFIRSALMGCFCATASHCATTDHLSTSTALGTARSSSALEAIVDRAGPLTVETVVGADWHVPRSGLLNLDHPKARAANITDGEEPIQLMFHAIRHPTRGLFLVDTGAERALRDAPDRAAISGLVAHFAHIEDLRVRTATGDWLARQHEPVRGVFLTHLHLDHVSGMRDVPAAAPIFVGPGDAAARAFMNLFTQGMVNDALAGKGPLRELRFQRETNGAFEAVLDVFGDQTFWAIWVPGHTPGSVAYLARTTNGPVLLAGDACHTAWGWQHGVEPGTFSDDQRQSAQSLMRLERFVTRHPGMLVRLGHQSLPAGAQDMAVSASLPHERHNATAHEAIETSSTVTARLH
jgi:glyoxylase-like metal-dependent hydrolase (beta-lactamase superfamily II)